MWSRLSMWVMAPGAAYRVDDRDKWQFFIEDATEKPFTWKGVNYTNGLMAGAPGYLDCEVPPGTYVVWAQRPDKPDPLTTHRAVVAVHDEPVVTVRLLPNPKPTRPSGDPPQDECEVQILGVEGVTTARSDYPRKLVVTGTASTCRKVHVVVTRMDGEGRIEGDVTVAADGTWEFPFANELKLKCGERVQVEAFCLKDRECRAREVLAVHCTKEDKGNQDTKQHS
jgi:hypothetical protein